MYTAEVPGRVRLRYIPVRGSLVYNLLLGDNGAFYIADAARHAR